MVFTQEIKTNYTKINLNKLQSLEKNKYNEKLRLNRITIIPALYINKLHYIFYMHNII